MARIHHLFLSRMAFLATLSVLGCHRFHDAPGPLSTDDYRYRAGSAIVGAARDTLRVAVVVVNESNQQRMLGFPFCPPVYNAVKARVAASRREWDSEVYEQKRNPIPRDSTGNAIPQVCPAMLPVMSFPPGGSYTYVLNVPVREVLGDSLPAGRYGVTARVNVNGNLVRNLDAGGVELFAPPI
jgi:hypothetical protein